MIVSFYRRFIRGFSSIMAPVTESLKGDKFKWTSVVEESFELIKKKVTEAPFKFFNFWADHPDFIGLAKKAWSFEVYGTPMFRLTRKLKCVKAILKAFNFRSFGRLHDRVVAAREALRQAQSAVLNSPSNPMLGENEKSCLKNYHDLAIAAEGFLKQKSRVQSLKLGDQNISFFHKAVKAHNARSALKVITMANG